MNLTDDIIRELEKRYRVKIEHPWARDPQAATAKDVETDKWFAAFLTAPAKSLGRAGDEWLPIVNVKADPELIYLVTGTEGICPAWHMSKRHWISILLDGTVETEQILRYIDDSFRIVTDSPTKRIYEAVKKIPRGKVATYGQVAAMAGNPRMSRAVGNALHKNPDGNDVPCYRVVNSKGELAEAFVFGGINVQQERLEADGIEVRDNRVDLKRYGIVVEEPADFPLQ